MVNPWLKKVIHARRERGRADVKLREAIIAAYDHKAGYTVDDIAETAGMTRQRVYQIVSEHKDST